MNDSDNDSDNDGDVVEQIEVVDSDDEMLDAATAAGTSSVTTGTLVSAASRMRRSKYGVLTDDFTPILSLSHSMADFN